MQKVKIKYTHPIKEGVQLEVVGWIVRVDGDVSWVKRIDGYMIDVPTANIIEQTVLM